jgi:hypothetical protein
MCDTPYVGPDCGEKLCLNDCTFPNGICNRTTGVCECGPTYSPYDRYTIYAGEDFNATFGGEDCSYCTSFAFVLWKRGGGGTGGHRVWADGGWAWGVGEERVAHVTNVCVFVSCVRVRG